ncbi:hypothetical protein G7Y89_g12516 [Cudoniella acicularis]|uniref:Uncharacterized protein n=1 Tax=Cudoniella acicularis TaxID=354080 RepID=A0A8H4RB94_9HELO|nr:hypothetical protein G7Y89_g12516 [Cudoniella acicularis]
MYTSRVLDGTPDDILNPSFRTVDFGDESAVITVASYMRHAWIAIPPPLSEPSYTQNDIGAFIRGIQNETETERIEREKNPDTTVHTPWRDAIYKMWNHVFWDVMKFLPHVGYGIGHFHPPNHKVFPLAFPGTSLEMTTKWDTNVLIIPAHLEQGVQVSMSRDVGSDENVICRTFESGKPYEIWYLKKGTEVKFYLEAKNKDERVGLAAVLMIGILCTDEHGETPRADEEADSEEQ